MDWKPSLDSLYIPPSRPQPLFTAAERRILELREELDRENLHQFDRQRERQHNQVDEDMIELGERRLQLQSIPINQPDPVLRRSWVKKKTHGKANTRSLTANELGERRQRQKAREQAEQNRLAMTEDDELARPSTPPPPSYTLPIRTPTTAERPRPRRTPSSDASPLHPSAYELPTSTAPPRLGGEKRRRVHTRRYKESVATGEITESQEVHKADRRG